MEDRDHFRSGLPPGRIVELIHGMRVPDLLRAREAVDREWRERLKQYGENVGIFAPDVATWSGDELDRVGNAWAEFASDAEYASDHGIQQLHH